MMGFVIARSPLSGLVFHLLKNGVAYEVVYPKFIEENSTGRDTFDFIFSYREHGETDYKNLLIPVSSTAVASTNIEDISIAVLRYLYKSISSRSNDFGISTGNIDELLNRDSVKVDKIRLEILKYATSRHEKLFEHNILVLEFVLAINANPEEIIRQLYYFHINDYLPIAGGNRVPGVLRENQHSSMLPWPISFGIEHKSEMYSIIDDFESRTLSLEEAEDMIDRNQKVFSKNVFIVHGRDLRAAENVANFISKCNLEPIILKDKADMGQTLIEKIERHGSPGYAIVIMAAEDEGRLRGSKSELKGRVRQNVLIELGFFLGKIGRERVLCLHEETAEIEIPSDYHGVLHKPFGMDGNWKLQVAQELKAANYDINLDDVLS